MKKPKIPNYMKGLLAKLPEEHPSRRPGAITIVEVQHDDWCLHWKGGVCNCNPNFNMVTKHD